ncbi:MAG: hypothetical protein HY898_14675 [Deltaproteobacteria bacterium]|nr:hypothetical protein [Deltaproteobacteria bacterium]
MDGAFDGNSPQDVLKHRARRGRIANITEVMCPKGLGQNMKKGNQSQQPRMQALIDNIALMSAAIDASVVDGRLTLDAQRSWEEMDPAGRTAALGELREAAKALEELMAEIERARARAGHAAAPDDGRDAGPDCNGGADKH